MDIPVDSSDSLQEEGVGGESSLRWQREIQLAEKEEDKWRKIAKKVIKRYRDERGSYGMGQEENRFNILWSNIQTMKPALYARTPKPVISHRFDDDAPVVRTACKILERALQYQLEAYDFDHVMGACVEDLLLPGRGITWERYEPHFRDVVPRQYVMPWTGAEGFSIGGEAFESEEAEQLVPQFMDSEGNIHDGENVLFDEQGLPYVEGDPYQEVEYEEVHCDYVHWEDFLVSPARTWGEVRWVARRSYLTKDEGVARFGEIFKQVPRNFKPKGMSKDDQTTPENEMFSKAVVWEIWNKTEKEVVWIVPGFDTILDTQDDPLRLHGFFPCPRPLFATTTNGSLVPIPDYYEYQDQARELDDLTNRIARLTSSLKVSGVYDSSQDGVKRLLEEGVENQLIPVDTWAVFAEKGGIKGVVDFFPIEMIANVLLQLYEIEKMVKNKLDEITGMADIIRGNSNPNETATAQSIKGQYASLRLRTRQGDIARFARDVLRLKAEIIAEHFSDETLAQVSGMRQDPMFAQALQLLRDDAFRSFRIDVEADSTVQIDEQEDKQARIELLQQMTGFMGQMVQVGNAMPPLLPVMAQMMQFAVRGFRAGRDLEGAIDQAAQQVTQMAMQPKPDPNAQKMQMEQAKANAEIQTNNAKVQGQLQNDAAHAQAQMEIEKQRFQHEANMDMLDQHRENAKLQAQQPFMVVANG